MTHPCLIFNFFFHLLTCAKQLYNLLLFLHYFFHVARTRSDQLSAFDEMSASQTNTNQGMMAAATKIIYSESARWSDTSISSPAGDRENRGGHYKVHIAGKVRSIFYPTLTPVIPQTRPFSPGTLPLSAPLKMEACFPSINCSSHLVAFEQCFIMQQFPFQHVLVYKFVHFVCESENVETLAGALPPA